MAANAVPPEVYHPDDYSAARTLGARLQAAGAEVNAKGKAGWGGAK